MNLGTKLLLAIAKATDEQRTRIESMEHWQRPRADSRYQSERLEADGWVAYSPTRWGLVPDQQVRNELGRIIKKLESAGLVERLTSGSMTIRVRLTKKGAQLKPSSNGVIE